MSPALAERLVAVAHQLRATPHGQKEAVYAAACQELKLSRPTLLRHLRRAAFRPDRKQRADTGEVLLTAEEAAKIATLIEESARKNRKRLLSLKDAVAILRANGAIQAGRLDETTGEFRPLSLSAISRGLRQYAQHSAQLSQPDPVTSLASRHPNQVWQVDASLCVLYYLKKQTGLEVMDHREFYHNKPKNLARIESERVWRYAITDHTSGTIYVEYVFGAESGENLSNVFIHAIQPKPELYFHGVPFIVMMDPGSANTGALFRSLAHGLGVRLIVDQPGNPRAKGQVECAHNLIETKFESLLRLEPVNSLPALNVSALRWMVRFNSQEVHSRHGGTRMGKWLAIRTEELRIPPAEAVCRELARSAPEERTVSDTLAVSYQGAEYDVSDVPGLLVGGKLLIARNPWREDAVHVVTRDADGWEQVYIAPRVARDQHGFRADAPVIGEKYTRHKDTTAQRNVKENLKLAAGAETLEAAEQFRKQKGIPFGGRLDPWKHLEQAPLPTPLPRRGTPLAVQAPRLEAPPLSVFEAAMQLKRQLGDRWTADSFRWLQARFPDGVPPDQLAGLVAQWAPELPLARAG